MKKKEIFPIGVVMTDSHLHKDNIEQVEDIWRQAIALCKKLKVNRIFHGGDLVTVRQAQPLEVLESIDRTKELLIEEGICLDIIEGNHDKKDLEAEKGYVRPFRDKFNFRVHGSYYKEDLLTCKVTIYMLPYFPEMGTYVERLKELEEMVDPKRKNILITHIGINGGLAHESASTNKEVPASIFEAFNTVLVGHYHNQCVIEDFIYYIGSTHQQNFGEDNQKGFTILYSDGSHEFVKSEFQEFRTMQVDADEIDTKFLKKLKNDIESSGDKVRVVITGDDSKLKTIDKKAFAQAGVSKIKLHTDSVEFDPNGIAMPTVQEYVSFTKKDIIQGYKKFCIGQEIDFELGLEYLQEIKG